MTLELLLGESVRFEPAGKVTQIFFDDLNEQVFSVRSGGATGLLSRGFLPSHCSTFRLSDSGQMMTIKLAPDQKLLSIQRNKDEVGFTPVRKIGPNGKLDERTFTQACKAKNAMLLGFSWINGTDILYFTNQSLELFSVVQERKLVKSVRSQAQTIAWYSFEPKLGLAVTSPTPTTTSLQPYGLKGGYIYKLPKIEFDRAEGVELREKDVCIAKLCGDRSFILVLLHRPSSGEPRTDVHLYEVSKDLSSVTKRHVLKVPAKGPVAVNVVDDLILVHHRISKSSFVFDIQMTADYDGSVHRHNPLCTGHVVLPETVESDSGVELYSPHWVTFQPDLVVDAKSGFMWKLKLRLQPQLAEIHEMSRMVKFLQQRESGKCVLLQVFLERCLSASTDVQTLGQAFDLVNKEYRQHLDNHIQQNMALPASTFPSPAASFRPFSQAAHSQLSIKSAAKVILDQADFFTSLFSPLADNPDVGLERLIALLLEYFRSLNLVRVPPQHFLNELLINLLVQRGSWFQLHQLLQYHVISDSKPLACLLLSLESVYPPSCQLALDMLHRLKNSRDEICEILLSKGMVVAAVKFAYANGLERMSARKFLEASMQEGGSDMDFYNTYSWFEERNLIGRDCDTFKQHYKDIFEENNTATQT